MSQDLLRHIDSISRERNIEKELLFEHLESAMIGAVRKRYPASEEVQVSIDRVTGDISGQRDGNPLDMSELGRIAAQTAKQVMIQKIREAERGSIFEEFSERKGTIVTGTVFRFEGGALVVTIGRAEGFLPRSEQIPGETHNPGERVRCLVLDVRQATNQVKIILSRTHPDFIRRLFELEVPEVSERIIEIKALAREAGYRTKIAVTSIDSKVDAVGACVGVRGSRIKNIVDELGGEKIDIVRWNESSQILIGNALKPAEISEIALCFELGRATVVVNEDQLSLAIGKRGQNVRLAARLTGWDIDILTPAEYNRGLDDLERGLKLVEGVNNEMIAKMVAMGMINLMDIEEVGPEPLVQTLEITQELADKIVETATEEAKRVAALREAEAAKAAALEAEQAAAEAAQAQQETPPPTDEAEEGTSDTVETAPQVPASEDTDAGRQEQPAEQTAGPTAALPQQQEQIQQVPAAGDAGETGQVEGP